MQCPSCGREQPYDSRFCRNCGGNLKPALVMPSPRVSSPRAAAPAPGGVVTRTMIGVVTALTAVLLIGIFAWLVFGKGIQPAALPATVAAQPVTAVTTPVIAPPGDAGEPAIGKEPAVPARREKPAPGTPATATYVSPATPAPGTPGTPSLVIAPPVVVAPQTFGPYTFQLAARKSWGHAFTVPATMRKASLRVTYKATGGVGKGFNVMIYGSNKTTKLYDSGDTAGGALSVPLAAGSYYIKVNSNALLFKREITITGSMTPQR